MVLPGRSDTGMFCGATNLNPNFGGEGLVTATLLLSKAGPWGKRRFYINLTLAWQTAILL
jgi:hypothetical protein